jgi:pyruvate-formate lyase-activating enzyme
LPGTDKVDLLCEMAAFGGYASSPADAPGLDREAHRQALIGFLGKHKSDAQFLRAHPDGRLTTRPADARWRKEWVQLYSENVASFAQVTNVPVGSALIE